MTDENSLKDQAQDLRQMMDHINKNAKDSDSQENMFVNKSNSDEIDLLNLPPRSEVHTERKTKVKWKLRYPIVRLLFVLFILIVVLLLTFDRLWGKDLFDDTTRAESASHHPAGDMVTVGGNLDDNYLEYDQNDSNLVTNSMTEKYQENQPQPFYYEVEADDTLSIIALRFYGDKSAEQIIIEANNLSSSTIEEGQVLLIP